MRQPLVSIVLPVHNSEKFIKSAILSILCQTYLNLELIIINDGSTDKTQNIIKKFTDKRLKAIFNTTKKGISYSLNLGLERSKGKYVARMDADDVSSPERIQKQVAYLEKHAEIGILGTAVRFINAKGKILGIKRFPQTDKKLRQLLIYGNPFIHPTIIFRKKLTDTYGGYDETLEGAEDYDLWLRLSKYTKIANLGQPLLLYRIHTGSATWGRHIQVDCAYAKAKWKSVRVYQYPKWHMVFLIKAIVSMILPPSLKRFWYETTFSD